MLEHYPHGWWSCSYRLTPVDKPPELAEFRRILREVKGRETGWPVWLSLDTTPEMTPRVIDGVIECWLRDTEDADYWRADPRGQLFLLRRLQEDTGEIQGTEPGKLFDVTLPIWRTGECLLHAGRLAPRLGATDIELTMTWHGLQGRELRTLASRGRRAPIFPGRTAHENEVRTTSTAEAASVSELLQELVEQLTRPLYARFDFFEPSSEFYMSELTELKRGL